MSLSESYTGKSLELWDFQWISDWPCNAAVKFVHAQKILQYVQKMFLSNCKIAWVKVLAFSTYKAVLSKLEIIEQLLDDYLCFGSYNNCSLIPKILSHIIKQVWFRTHWKQFIHRSSCKNVSFQKKVPWDIRNVWE